jgi:uncharacterized protein YecE (DUF72 family)
MQDSLFPEETALAPAAAPAAPAAIPTAPETPRRRGNKVLPCPPDEALQALARALPPRLRLGGSSWSYPGWKGLVWDGEHSESKLAREGLTAYAQHPLFRSVCIDRSFYRALTAQQYARYAAQVPDDFRFVVKAPASVTDATVRSETGRAVQENPVFLNAEIATREFIEPALDGLGTKLGVLVFQLSPLPLPLLARLDEVFERLRALLRALPSIAAAPDAVIAVEVRDPEFLTPAFASLLRECGAAYCLGLQAKMPPIDGQLPMLRAMWPGPLVCRWNLNPVNGAYGYESAEKRYAPFDKVVDPDPHTGDTLARVIAGTVGAGHPAYVTISNHAEGCAPLTAAALARAVAARSA